MSAKRLLEIYDEMKNLSKVAIKIDYDQVVDIIVKDLIKKRMHCYERNQKDDVEHFDSILKYYLGDDDFKKYVINSEEITI